MAELERKTPGPFHHLAAPAFPQFRFEWHPGAKKVYVVRGRPEVGNVLAEEITSAFDARSAVLVWLRGYTERQSENLIIGGQK